MNFESDHKKILSYRTIINYMENGVILYGLISVSLVEMIEVIRMIYGPLNPSICWFQMFWRNGPTQGAMLELDAIIIFRVSTQKNIYFKLV